MLNIPFECQVDISTASHCIMVTSSHTPKIFCTGSSRKSSLGVILVTVGSDHDHFTMLRAVLSCCSKNVFFSIHDALSFFLKNHIVVASVVAVVTNINLHICSLCSMKAKLQLNVCCVSTLCAGNVMQLRNR